MQPDGQYECSQLKWSWSLREHQAQKVAPHLKCFSSVCSMWSVNTPLFVLILVEQSCMMQTHCMHSQRWRFILGIWQHCDSIGLRLTRFDKAQFEKTQKKMLVVSLEGTLIPSVLLPAHFMPRSALIDVKIGLQMREYQCVCLGVCLFVPHTCSFACVSRCFCSCGFYYFALNPVSVLFCWIACVSAPVQPEHITLIKGTQAF